MSKNNPKGNRANKEFQENIRKFANAEPNKGKEGAKGKRSSKEFQENIQKFSAAESSKGKGGGKAIRSSKEFQENIQKFNTVESGKGKGGANKNIQESSTGPNKSNFSQQKDFQRKFSNVSQQSVESPNSPNNVAKFGEQFNLKSMENPGSPRIIAKLNEQFNSRSLENPSSPKCIPKSNASPSFTNNASSQSLEYPGSPRFFPKPNGEQSFNDQPSSQSLEYIASPRFFPKSNGGSNFNNQYSPQSSENLGSPRLATKYNSNKFNNQFSPTQMEIIGSPRFAPKSVQINPNKLPSQFVQQFDNNPSEPVYSSLENMGNRVKPTVSFFRPQDQVQAQISDYTMSYNPSQPPMLPENNPPIQRKPTPENKPSLLLSKEENQSIFDILGKGRQQTLSTAVVQYLVPTPDQQKWQKKETGVVCLVRDTTKRSYFIQVLSLRTKSMVFRQEIYNQFEYHMPASFFLTFEGDNSMVGINFADITEATNFRDVLDNKLETKRQRRYERRSKIMLDTPNQNQSQSQVHQVASPPPPPLMPNGTGSNNSNNVVTTTYNFSFKPKNKKNKDKDKKKLLRKEDIGNPMDFRHIQHVGWDPNKGFDLAGVDSDFRTFFEKAGVSANELQDENTRQFIYNFIETHGGVEAVKRSVSSTGRAVANAPSVSSTSGPPPVPARQPSIPNANYPNHQYPQQSKPAAPAPPSRPNPPPPPAATYPGGSAAPPPPARSTSHVSPSQNHHPYQQNNGKSYVPAPPSSKSQGDSVPPPPPPPPPPTGGPPPPPPPPQIFNGDVSDSGNSNNSRGPPIPAVEDDRSNLMKQIQRGIQLKHVDADAQPKKSGGGTLADCLGQIQRGVDLKPVPENVKGSSTADMEGLAGALARALADRSRAIHPDSSSSGEEDEDNYDEDEWD